MQAAHGYPALLAETFVDVSRFAGTCYRASNWRSLGFTRGFAREPGGAARWRHHGQPKEVFVFELTDGAPEALSRVEMPAKLEHRAAHRADGRATAAQPVRVSGRGARVPPCPGQALCAQHHSDACRRRPACRLPGGERIRPVRRPALPGAAQGGGRLLEPLQAALHPARDHHLPTTSLPPCRQRPWTTPSASGPASMAARTRPSPWTERTCAAPRSRPKTGAG